MEWQIMRTAKLLASSVFAAALLILAPQVHIFAAAAPAATQAAPAGAQAKSAAAPSDKQDKNGRPQPVHDGDTIFRQNCARCHNAPESFSPRVTTAVVRHMRVRANLSEEDARALLKFFNQ
jgi:cytochrome c5